MSDQAFDLEALIRAEVEKAVKAQTSADDTTTTQQQAQAPTPIRVNVGGQVTEYANTDALSAAINQTLTSFGAEKARLEAQIAAQPKDQGSHATGNERVEPTFDMDSFVAKMQKDPREGINYALNDLIFEGKSDNAALELRRMADENELLKKTVEAARFKDMHQEYPGGENVGNAVEHMRQRLNLPYTAEGLDAAYTMAIRNNVIPNFPALYQQAQQYQQENPMQSYLPPTNTVSPYFPNPNLGVQTNPTQWNGGGSTQGLNPAPQFAQFTNPQPQLDQNPYLRGMPMVNRGGQAPQGAVDYDNLSTEQIEAIMTKMGLR